MLSSFCFEVKRGLLPSVLCVACKCMWFLLCVFHSRTLSHLKLDFLVSLYGFNSFGYFFHSLAYLACNVRYEALNRCDDLGALFRLVPAHLGVISYTNNSWSKLMAYCVHMTK